MTHRKNFRLVQGAAALLISTSLFLLAGCTSKANLDPTNTFYTFTPAKIKGLDPIFSDDVYSAIESARIYDTLLQYSYLKRPYQLEGCLAEGLPTISKDGKTYTFKIKKGVVFQDDNAFKATNGKGRELVADDFIYSFKRLADPKLNSPQWWLLDGKVAGLNEWHDAQAKNPKVDYTAAIPGLKALDPYTLQIQLTTRSYQFIYALSMVSTAAVAHEVVDEYGQEFLNHPVGTGPFKLAEYNPQAKIVYVKNPTYRKELFPAEGADADMAGDVGKPLPLVDKIVMTVHVESQPQWLNFMQGNLDVSSIPKDNFQQAIDQKTNDVSPELKKKGILLAKDTMLDVTHTTFNMSDPVVGKNKYLRQAISMAVDNAQEIQLFYNGRAISAQGPIPPGMNGYDESMKNPYKGYDVAKAKELLKKAGFPDGKGLAPLEFLSLADSQARQQTEYFEKELAAIGITLKIQTYSWPEFQASIKNKKGQMWGYAWAGDYPDAENFLQLFYGKNISPGANDANYVNPEFDKLYDKALTMADSTERTALYKKMSAIVVEDEPWVFGLHRLNYTLKYPWVKNYRYHEFPYGMSKYYRIETSLRK
jgi:oligopeptide transport system substrate-binding protein